MGSPSRSLTASEAFSSPSTSHHQLPTAAEPAPAQHNNAPLSTLLTHLLASKRSLTSIHLVQHATTLLHSARTAVESTSVLIARTKYLRRSLASQVKILRGVQFELEGAATAIQTEVKAALKELDDVDARLDEVVQSLQHTRVERAFGTVENGVRSTLGERVGQEDEENEEEEGGGGRGGENAKYHHHHSLYDFVDPTGPEELRRNLKAAVDNVERAKIDMDRSVLTLEEDLQAINAALTDDSGYNNNIHHNNNPEMSSSSTALDTIHNLGPRALLKGLEDHAREMAQGLESLVKHFDLCVTAIKHTEGGGDAVARTVVDDDDLPEGLGVAEEDLEAPAQPMTEEERIEMLQVLENDAAEVDDVVVEMQDRSADMEAQLDAIQLWRERSEAAYNDVDHAFDLLEKVGARLSAHVAESARYASKWADEKAKIEDGMAGMDELREIFENFLNAYDGLIVEVARRKSVRRKMLKIVQDAHAQLDQLYEYDVAERETFTADQGNFLPADIWPGLGRLPARFAIVRTDEGVDDGDETSLPDLPKKTVEEALKRLKAGAGGKRRGNG